MDRMKCNIEVELKSELEKLGLFVKDDLNFSISKNTDTFRIRMSSMLVIMDLLNISDKDIVNARISSVIARELFYDFMRKICESVTKLAHEITERKFIIDEVLEIIPQNQDYSRYVVNAIKEIGYNYNNCITLSDSYLNLENFFQKSDISIITDFNPYRKYDYEYMYGNKKYKHLYAPFLDSSVTNRYYFIFYNDYLGTIVNNPEYNNLSEEKNPFSYSDKLQYLFYYSLHMSDYKVVSIEIPNKLNN